MRKTYLDNIKWITVVLVVIYHVLYMFNSIIQTGLLGAFSEVQYQDAYLYIVYPWFMLLFFTVSGITARYAITSCSNKEFIKKRTRRYIVPTTIGLFVFWWIMGYYNMAIGGAFETMGSVPGPIKFFIMAFSGIGVMWYVQMLWIFSLLLVLIRKIEKDRFYNFCAKSNIIVLLLLTFVIFGAAQILNTPIILVYRFGIYGVGFFIGYFVLSHDEVIEKLQKWWIALTAAFVILAVAFTIYFWGQPCFEHVVLKRLLCNVYAWIAVLAIIAFMSKFGNFESKFTKWMSSRSWGLYLLHYLTIAICGFYMKKYVPTWPPVVFYIACTISGFAGAYVLYAILRRIPFVRWAVLGEGKNV